MATYCKLGRETSHRNLMLRNLVTDLLRNGKIEIYLLSVLSTDFPDLSIISPILFIFKSGLSTCLSIIVESLLSEFQDITS